MLTDRTEPPPDDDPRVYPVREDSELLLPFAEVQLGTGVLEIGCGHGAASLRAARSGAHVVATDLNPFALRHVRTSAKSIGVRVDVVRTDLADGLGRFDRILANPPYLPTLPAERDPDPWVNLALDGGPDGCSLTERVLHALPDHLKPGGRAYLLVSSRQEPARREQLAADWRAPGGSLTVVARRELGSEVLHVWELRPAENTPRRDAERL